MKKLIPILVLMAMSTNVFAEWTVVKTNDKDDELTTYVDFGTIRKKGNIVKMWVLGSRKTVQELKDGRKYLSVSTRDEYDCEEGTDKLLDMIFYSGNMGDGVIESIRNIELKLNLKPEAVSPGSMNEAMFKIACGIK